MFVAKNGSSTDTGGERICSRPMLVIVCKVIILKRRKTAESVIVRQIVVSNCDLHDALSQRSH